jgi:hypothetical protein
MKIINPQPTANAPGEAVVLQWLHELKDDWIVIHQARFPKRRKFDVPRVIDFIFVVPGHGILALEVKSSPHVQYVDGTFRVGRDEVDPLAQVDDEFGVMYRWHQDTFARSTGTNLPMTAVLGLTAAMPGGPNPQQFIENPRTHQRYQVFYADSFASAAAMRNAILAALSQVASAWGTSALDFGPKEATKWVDELMPSVSMNPTQTANVSKFVTARDEFTEQQQKYYYGLLKVIPKVFISGAWGTGKTFLAKHIAFRSARDGRRVCVVVKRKELMRQLQNEFQEELLRKGPVTGSINVAIIDSLVGPRASKRNRRFDELVLDQAEDFLDVQTLEQLESVLVNGWGPESRVKIFADFHHQGYQSPSSVKEVLNWLERAGFAGVQEPPLSHNLRNGKLIAQNVEKITRSKVYTDYLPEDGGVRVITVEPGPILPISTEEHRETPLRTWNVSQALVNVLRDLKEEGFAPGDVVVLTALPRTSRTQGEPVSSQSSPAFVALGWDFKAPSEGDVRNGRDGSAQQPYVPGDFRMRHDRQGLPDEWIPRDRTDQSWEGDVDENDQMVSTDLSGHVTWCTVEEFAGCESTVVVLTDVHMASEHVREKRLTRGISRASQRAIVIVVNLQARG